MAMRCTECVHVPIELEESQVLDQQDLDQKLESIPADEVFRWKGRAPFTDNLAQRSCKARQHADYLATSTRRLQALSLQP